MLDVIRRRLSAGPRLMLAGGLILILFCLCAGIVLYLTRSGTMAPVRALDGLSCADTAWQYMTTGNPEFLPRSLSCSQQYDPNGISGAINQYTDEIDRQEMLIRILSGAGAGVLRIRDGDAVRENLAGIQIRQMPELWAIGTAMENIIRQPPTPERSAEYEKIRSRLRGVLAQMQADYAGIYRDSTDGTLRSQLEPMQKSLASAAEALDRAGNTAINHHRAGFVKAWDDWQQTLMQIWPEQQQALSKILQKRTTADREQLLISMALMAVFAVLVLLVLGLAGMGMTRRFGTLEGVLQQINSGERNADLSALSCCRETDGIAQELIRLQKNLSDENAGNATALHDANQRADAAEKRVADAAEEVRDCTTRAAEAAQRTGDALFRASAAERRAEDAATEQAKAAEAYTFLEEKYNAVIAELNETRREYDALSGALSAARVREEEILRAAGESCREAAENARQEITVPVVSVLGAGLAALAGRDLTFRSHTPVPKELSALQENLNMTAQQFAGALCTIEEYIRHISGAGMKIRDSAGLLSQRMEDQVEALEASAGAAAEVSARLTATVNKTEMAYGDAVSAREGLLHDSENLRTAAQSLQVADDACKQVWQVIAGLDEMAFQANLLALDAGVPRSGESGQMPANLAAGMRALAGQSADAARAIRRFMTTTENELRQSLTRIGACDDAASGTTEILAAMADTLLAAVCAGRDMARDLAEAGATLRNLAREIRQNAVIAGENAVMREGVVSSAAGMHAALEPFHLHS